MTILLAGDIGGTKTILRLVKAEPPKSAGHIPQLTHYMKRLILAKNIAILCPLSFSFSLRLNPC
jgi:glucokinase